MAAQAGKLQKLHLEVVQDSSINYDVLFNPETYAENVTIEYDIEQASGTSATQIKYKKTKPQEYTLNLVFDSTGVTVAAVGYDPGTVAEQIAKFKKVTLEYRGEDHMPPEVKLSWGAWIFQGHLTKLDITYELFSPEAEPLRAKAQATFTSTVSEALRAQKENKSSPDLTHVRTVELGDTLPLMCHRIYGDSKYYLRVAEVNGLNNFRRLKPGAKIYFPPLDKTTA